MSISIDRLEAIGIVVISVDMDSIEEFKHMVARAMNTWQNASDTMEEFSQLIQHGKIMQSSRTESDKRAAINDSFFDGTFKAPTMPGTNINSYPIVEGSQSQRDKEAEAKGFNAYSACPGCGCKEDESHGPYCMYGNATLKEITTIDTLFKNSTYQPLSKD